MSTPTPEEQGLQTVKSCRHCPPANNDTACTHCIRAAIEDAEKRLRAEMNDVANANYIAGKDQAKKQMREALACGHSSADLHPWCIYHNQAFSDCLLHNCICTLTDGTPCWPEKIRNQCSVCRERDELLREALDTACGAIEDEDALPVLNRQTIRAAYAQRFPGVDWRRK